MDSENCNILVWNVRGLNARARRDALRTIVGDVNVLVVCFQETKLREISQYLVCELLGSRFTSFAFLPSNGASGGILITCRGPELVYSLLHIGRFSITVNISTGASQDLWCFTAVYDPQPEAEKLEFLNELRSIQSMAAPFWMIAGDFNLLLDASDKNTNSINRAVLGSSSMTCSSLTYIFMVVPIHGATRDQTPPWPNWIEY